MPTDLGQILDTKMTLLIISHIAGFLVIINLTISQGTQSINS